MNTVTNKDSGYYKGHSILDSPRQLLQKEDSLLKSYAHQQEIVAALGQKALMNVGIGKLMNEAMVLLTDALQVSFGGVWEFLPDKNQLLLRSALGWNKSFKLDKYSISASENSPAACVLASHAPEVIVDLSQEDRFTLPEILTKYKITSGMLTVIEGGEMPYGVIGIYSDLKRKFSKDELHFLQSVANVLALAISRKQTEDRIRTNEQRLALAQSAANIGTFEWNIRTGETIMTPEFEALYGCRPGEMRQNPKRWFEVIHPDDQERVKIKTETTLKAGSDLNIEYRVIWPDKSIHWLLVKGHMVHDNNQKVRRMLGVAIDIGDRKQTEEGVEFLSEASRILSSSLDYQTTLSSVAKLAVPKIADWCSLDMITDGSKVEQIAIVHVDPSKTKWAQEWRRRNPVDLNSDFGVAKVIKTNQSEFYPVVDQKLLREKITEENREIIDKIGFTSVIIVPLLDHKQVIGAITLVNAESQRHFSKSDLEIAEQLANRASLAIENARLYQAAQLEIAERKKIEGELLGSRNQLEIIIQNVADAIMVQDKEGKLIYTNDKGLKLIDCGSMAELAGLSWSAILECFDIYDEYKNPLELSRLPGRRTVGGERNPQIILFLRHKQNHQEYWLNVKSRPVYDAEGNILMVVNILSDITEEKQSEQDHLKLASIVEASDDAIFSKDLSGQVTSWNTGAEKMYGYSAKEMIGWPITKIMLPSQLDEFAEIMEIIKLGESIDHLETVRVRKDGKIIDVSVSVAPLKDQHGQVIGASTIARDISITKELERRKDAFIGMASHELKTPITSMKAFTQVIGRRLETSPDAQLRTFLTKLDNQIDRLADLVNDLLDLSKIQAGKLELNKQKFNIGKLIQETVEDIQSVTPTHVIYLKGVIDQEILGDKDRIGQILVNLLTNAVKYSPGKDKIMVKTSPNKNKVTVCVQDFGIGIDQSDQTRIFDRFFREQGASEKTFPGLGIGLYITAELVRRHGGHIWVKSKKGEGSSFFVSFPIE